MCPMMSGVEIPAMLPQRLKSAPFMPTMPRGEVSEITVQPSAPTPLPKNESDMNKIMRVCDDT